MEPQVWNAPALPQPQEWVFHQGGNMTDAESRIGRMLDELMRSLEQDHQELVLHQGGKMVVQVLANSIKPESPKIAVQKQLQLQRNKALKSDVFSYRPGDAAKNNGRVGGKAEAIVPRTVEPPAKKGWLKCGDMRHCVAWCPKTSPGEAETLLAAQVKRSKDGIKVLVNQPQRQKTERGVLLENIVRVDDVLLDSGSDVTAWVNDASTATELIGSRPVNELLGFSIEDLLVGARKKKEEWDVSFVPTNELSGMANVQRLMAEKLNPTELDPDDGMECATPEDYPKISVEDETERRRTKQGTGLIRAFRVLDSDVRRIRHHLDAAANVQPGTTPPPPLTLDTHKVVGAALTEWLSINRSTNEVLAKAIRADIESKLKAESAAVSRTCALVQASLSDTVRRDIAAANLEK
ncbi:hypothetical protein B5M09_011558 [Aphanomyces astaci]|uniref:Uncharacterized protein n=1 Tax=Aphanomyces astaci TaxID=112090 RepID=A0A3R7W9X8_APHAT|nr:hypothetical protein B5M09_011558 [Aphanomyces astaci]